MKTDLLACRHIGVNKADAEVMLRKIGVGSLDELIDKTIPANIRLKAPLALPAPMTEYEFARHIAELASKNKLFDLYRHGVVQHNHSGSHPTQRLRKPRLVYFLYSLPDRSFARQTGSFNEFPNRRMRLDCHAIGQLLSA